MGYKTNQMDAMKKLMSTPGKPKAKVGDGIPIPEGVRSLDEANMKNKGKLFNSFVKK